MLQFRYTCERHRQMFVAVVKRAGCSDPAEMDDIRRRLLAWLSARYPRMVLDHFHEGTCLGCELEARFGDASEIDRAIRAVEEMASAKADQT